MHSNVAGELLFLQKLRGTFQDIHNVSFSKEKKEGMVTEVRNKIDDLLNSSETESMSKLLTLQTIIKDSLDTNNC